MTTGRWTRFVLAAAALGLGGCLQLETNIKLNEDGSAVVTERLAISRRLLEIDKGDKGSQALESRLTKEAALERAKQMGSGTTVVSHELRDGEKGARESVVVFRNDDLTNLVYLSPFVGHGGYQAQALRFGIRPALAGAGWYYCGVTPGHLIVSFRSQKYTNAVPGAAKAGTAAIGTAPADIQAVREVVPVFTDMLDDFRVKVTLETYCSFSAGGGVVGRDLGLGVRHVDLIDVSGKEDMDKYGYRFVKNEEIMAEIIQRRLNGRFWSDCLYTPLWSAWDYRPEASLMRGNATLPLVPERR